MKKLAILASGSGTNAENIHKFFARGNRIKVDLVVYDRASAGVAPRMQALGVETLHLPKKDWEENPEKLIEILRSRGIDLVVLAGFLRVIPPEITRAFSGRIINIHPSLLPAYGGMGMFGHKVHEAVIAAGEKKSGVTVHYVTDDVDGGEILMQEEVEISPDDTPESLEQKIHKVEYSLFPRAIVAALRRLDEASSDASKGALEIAGEAESGGATPPPIPTPAEEWAETLGVKFDAGALSSPPPMPHVGDAEFQSGNERVSPPRNGARSPRYPAMANAGNDMPPMPQTYLVWSVVMTVLCCLPAGIAAIIFSSQVSSRYYAGDLDGAKRASERAQVWIIVSFVLGVLANTLYLPILLIAA